jgi:hypothetical protein
LQQDTEIVSLTPRLKRDINGQPTQEAHIVIGIRKLPPQPDGMPANRLPPFFQVQAIGPDGQPYPERRQVDCVLEEEGVIRIDRAVPPRPQETG